MTYISGDRIRNGNNSAVSVRALGVGPQPTTTIRYGAFGVLSIVEARRVEYEGEQLERRGRNTSR
jgi:hypothetical protein